MKHEERKIKTSIKYTSSNKRKKVKKNERLRC